MMNTQFLSIDSWMDCLAVNFPSRISLQTIGKVREENFKRQRKGIVL
jgi:hypothetical protein